MRRRHTLGIDVGLYIQRGRQWVLFAVLPAILVSIGAYLYTARQQSIYQATSTLFVQQAQISASGIPGSLDTQGSGALAQAYTQMIVDPVILRAVDAQLGHRYPGYRIEHHALQTVQSNPTQNSQVVGVQVEDTDPARAVAAANAVTADFVAQIRRLQRARYASDQLSLQHQIDTAQAHIQALTVQIEQYHGPPEGLSSLRAAVSAYQNTNQSLTLSLEQFRATTDSLNNQVSLYSPAVLPRVPVGPHPARLAIIAGFVALLLLGATLFLYDYVNDLPRSPEEVEAITGAAILGTVQEVDMKTRRPESHSHVLSEAYRLIRTNIQFTRIDKPLNTLLVTSALPSEGKSTTASQLATVYADGGALVTLIDADLRRPSLHRVFDVPRKGFGLTNMLLTEPGIGEGTTETDNPNLTIVPSGPTPPNPADLLSSQRMVGVLERLRANRGGTLLIIDSPPILAVADAAILSTMVDGVILVVDPQSTRRRDLRQACESIQAVGGVVIGVVMNRLRQRSSMYYYYTYGNDVYGKDVDGASKSKRRRMVRADAQQSRAGRS